jgi:tetratricopeptide (TPR) repeat protein
MSVDLYERYMDALRRGHMAVARGHLEAALVAYREAVGLAPDRAQPHVGVAQVLLRQDFAAEALATFDVALARAPRNEAALRGRSDALARLGRRTDAAESLDILSEIQEASGRLPEATETTRRALELAEQKARRRRLQDLMRRLRLASIDQPGDQALAGALHRLETSDTGVTTADVRAGTQAEADVAHAAAAELAEIEAAEEPPPAEPSAPRPDPIALVLEGEEALDAGDQPVARRAYLEAATAFAAEGLVAAALDACYVALAFAPDDAELHLRLVELYLASGWNEPAADKLALLGRLTELDGRQGHARARIVGLAADHFPDDPRLRRLSAKEGTRR